VISQFQKYLQDDAYLGLAQYIVQNGNLTNSHQQIGVTEAFVNSAKSSHNIRDVCNHQQMNKVYWAWKHHTVG
jgi:hypothetical protein